MEKSNFKVKFEFCNLSLEIFNFKVGICTFFLHNDKNKSEYPRSILVLTKSKLQISIIILEKPALKLDFFLKLKLAFQD